MKPHLAIVNPAAGGGRCGKLAPQTLQLLQARGAVVEVVETRQVGDATTLAKEGYQRGFRHFIAVGGDGTSFEIVNGLFPNENPMERVALGFLPLGTGNSFLRDFTDRGLPFAVEAILQQKTRPCDVLVLKHRQGQWHFINLMSIGFTAEAGKVRNKRFKPLGEAGYLLATLLCWSKLHYPTFPLRVDQAPELDARPCTYLTFSNSRYTGGKFLIAPFADTADGLIELTRVGTLKRWDFAKTFPKIFTGAHMEHPLISRESAHRVDLQLSELTDVMIDGEIVTCIPESIEVLPQALDVLV
ncbi:MAG: YegS/Rv2252/BmrU family lipid kinase [Terriglobia bacterium]